MRTNNEKEGDVEAGLRTLADWGEFRLIKEVILPTLKDFSLPLGDDCAYVSVPETNGLLAISSDAAPKPLVWQLDTTCKAGGLMSVAVSKTVKVNQLDL